MLSSILDDELGWAGSRAEQLLLASDGSPLLWFTYPAIEYCRQFDASGLNVFEFGASNSCRFWINRGANVWCVEHDPAWLERV